MTLLTRAGWILCAALFGTLTANIFHVDHAGWLPDLLLCAFAVLACVSPRRALLALLALVPVAWYFASRPWNSTLAWAEALTCAALTGFALDRAGRRLTRSPGAIGAPALLFGAVVLTALVAGLAVLQMKFGPVFTPLLTSQITREFFTDARTSPALHAGLLLLEGTLLAVHAARLAAERPIAAEAAAATAIGATLSAACTLLNLVQTAWRYPTFVSTLIWLIRTGRWATFADFNAAGSFYAMALLIAVALAVKEKGTTRGIWAACAVLIGSGLWLTSSRFALLAVPIAAGAAWLAPQVIKGRGALVRTVAIAAAACLLLVVIAVALPKRGIQHGVGDSLGVRIGLIGTGGRMMRSHPLFGIGLGEFQRRSAEFSSPALLAAFPIIAATGENAHNNFIQIAAELGIAGGVLFAWLIAAALAVSVRAAIAHDDRFLLLLAAGGLAFVLTCLGGHPLLIPEPAYVFWMWIGLLAGLGVRGEGSRGVQGRHGKIGVALALALIAGTLPSRMHALVADTDFEHVGINVSPLWQLSPDGIKYRDAKGHATLFVPTGAIRVSINLRSDRPARLEMKLDGQLANVQPLAPQAWNDLTIPARTVRATSKFSRLDLTLLDDDETVMWITKVQPIGQ